jgi:hypothetical protein
MVAYAIVSFIGASLVCSVLIYAIVVEVIKKKDSPFSGYAPLPDVIDILRYTMLGIAVAQYFLIRYINKAILSQRATMFSNRANAAVTKILTYSRLIVGPVIVYALCESVAIYGLILFLIQGKSFDFYLFMIISLSYFAIFFPRYNRWESWIKERESSVQRLSS